MQPCGRPSLGRFCSQRNWIAEDLVTFTEFWWFTDQLSIDDMRIIVSRKYMPFSSLVLIVGTGFKGSWQKMLFLERRNLQLEGRSARGTGSNFSYFLLSCGLCFLFIAVVAHYLFPCFAGSHGLLSLHTKLFSASSFFLKRGVYSISVLLCFGNVRWADRDALFLQGSKEGPDWSGRAETDCF